jgi:hypothetical protein
MLHFSFKKLELINISFIAFFLILVSCTSITSPPADQVQVPDQNSLVADGDRYLFGGDVIINKDQTELINSLQSNNNGLSKTAVSAINVYTWPKGVIRYTLSGFNANETKVILSVMTDIQNACGVTYVQMPKDSPYVYVIKKIKSSSIGGESTAGWGSGPHCNLGQIVWGTIAHEFIHGLGFYHEHQRPDRNQYINILYSNITSQYQYAFNALTSPIEYLEGTNFSNRIVLWKGTKVPYDYQSIMHYPGNAFSRNGQPTIMSKGKSVTLSQTKCLTSYDKAKLLELYPFKNVPNKKPVVNITNPITQAKLGLYIINATATDLDGTISKVSFYVNDKFLGSTSIVPYSYTTTFKAGTYSLKAVATDNKNDSSTSPIVTITAKNKMPTISITSNVNNAVANASVSITAVVADSDGTISQVSFFDTSSAKAFAIVSKAPFTANFKVTTVKNYGFKAIVIDNDGASTTSKTIIITATSQVTQPFTWASDLTWKQVANGWGSIEKDKSNGEKAANDGKTITLNTKTYSKGFGCHSSSEISIPLNKAYTRFTSDIGIDDEVSAGTVRFQVLVDGVSKFISPVMNGKSTTQSINIVVTGATTLTLKVDNGGDNSNSDHADWADAKLLK